MLPSTSSNTSPDKPKDAHEPRPRGSKNEESNNFVLVPKRWTKTRHLPSGLTEASRRIVGFWRFQAETITVGISLPTLRPAPELSQRGTMGDASVAAEIQQREQPLLVSNALLLEPEGGLNVGKIPQPSGNRRMCLFLFSANQYSYPGTPVPEDPFAHHQTMLETLTCPVEMSLRCGLCSLPLYLVRAAASTLLQVIPEYCSSTSL
jgi:hypothetical protein